MKKIKIIHICLLIVILFGFIAETGTVSQDNDVVVIINKKRSNLTREQVKKIFRGKTMRWPDGSELKILLNKDAVIYNDFCRKYLNKSTRDIDNIWSKKQIRDGVPLPRKVPSNVIGMLVANSPVFIGFVRRGEANDKVNIIE